MMNLDAFAQMPDDARLWAYAFDRALTPEDTGRIDGMMAVFLPQWVSHGSPVTGAYTVFENRFLLIAGTCTDGIGGCSTDASVRMVQEIGAALEANAFDRTLVFFRNGGGRIVAVSRNDFKELVAQKHVAPETLVFDTTIQTVADLRAGRFETTFEKSWHARAFR